MIHPIFTVILMGQLAYTQATVKINQTVNTWEPLCGTQGDNSPYADVYYNEGLLYWEISTEISKSV